MCIKEKCICATGMLPTEVLLLQHLHTYEELLVYGRLIQATLHKHVHFIPQQQTSNTITVAPPLRKMNQIRKNIYTVFLIQTQMFHCKWNWMNNTSSLLPARLYRKNKRTTVLPEKNCYLWYFSCHYFLFKVMVIDHISIQIYQIKTWLYIIAFLFSFWLPGWLLLHS